MSAVLAQAPGDPRGTSQADLEEAVVTAWAYLAGTAADPVPADVVAEELERFAAGILAARPELRRLVERARGWQGGVST
jgi:hypothetical protein